MGALLLAIAIWFVYRIGLGEVLFWFGMLAVIGAIGTHG